MTELTDKIFAVDVPMDSIRHEIINGVLAWTNPMHDKSKQVEHDGEEFLPQTDGAWEILGTVTNGVIDFDVSGIVEEDSRSIYFLYKNYISDYEPVFTSAAESFISLLTSKSLDINRKYLIVEKVKT